MSKPSLKTQRFATADVVAASVIEGPLLLALPPGVDGVILMLAISAVETGGGEPQFIGHDCGPRYEPSYDVGGSFWKISTLQRELVECYEGQAACSFGPWQMMYCNFPFHLLSSSYKLEPTDLLRYNDRQAAYSYASDFSEYFNHYIPHFKPQSLEDIGEIWNSGHIVQTTTTEYAKKLVAAYSKCAVYKFS